MMVYLACKKTANTARCTMAGQPHAITESRFNTLLTHRIAIRNRSGGILGYLLLSRDGDVWRCREAE